MIGAQMTYGALAVKVKALYGKRLRFSDYEALVGLSDEGAMLDYLGQHPGWCDVVARLRNQRGTALNRTTLERTLRDQVRADYLSLLHFVPKKDKALMADTVKQVDKDAILNALHRLKAGPYYLGALPSSHYPLKSHVNLKGLEECASYAQLVEATQGSIYYEILKNLTLQADGLPDYTVADGLLHTAYLASVYRIIRREYKGLTQKTLLKSYGLQVDLLNLTTILRLKTYAPQAPQSVYLSVLFPFHYRLKSSVLLSMCQADDVAGVFSLLQDTPYRALISPEDVRHVEQFYRHTFYQFNKRQLMGGTPSIYTPIAYLHIKASELQALINVVECVKYGVPYDKDFAKLVGG